MADLSSAFTLFRGSVALQQKTLAQDGKTWRFFDSGPKNIPPIVCIPGTSGTAAVFFLQILSLASKGYRIISVQYPPSWTHEEWAHSFDRFLDSFDLREVHLFGASLGGLLSLVYTSLYPNRVSSLVLCNGFCDNSLFASRAPCLSMFPYMPDFYLKKYILDNFPKGLLEESIAKAVDFVVEQLETLPQSETASRLTLNCLTVSQDITNLSFPQDRMTFIDVMEDISLPQELRDQLHETFPDTKRALIKTGGDFPFLSRADEVNMHLQVHLRGIGLFPDITIPEEKIS